jgi:hypothetical protein
MTNGQQPQSGPFDSDLMQAMGGQAQMPPIAPAAPDIITDGVPVGGGYQYPDPYGAMGPSGSPGGYNLSTGPPQAPQFAQPFNPQQPQFAQPQQSAFPPSPQQPAQVGPYGYLNQPQAPGVQNTPYPQTPYAQQPQQLQQPVQDPYAHQFGVPVGQTQPQAPAQAPQYFPAQAYQVPVQQGYQGQQSVQVPQQPIPQAGVQQQPQQPQQPQGGNQIAQLISQLSPEQLAQVLQGQGRDAQGQFAAVERPRVPQRPTDYDPSMAITDPQSSSARYEGEYRDYQEKLANYNESLVRRQEMANQKYQEQLMNFYTEFQNQQLKGAVSSQLAQWGVLPGNTQQVGTQAHFMDWASRGETDLPTLWAVYQQQHGISQAALQQARAAQAQAANQVAQMHAPVPSAASQSGSRAPAPTLENEIFNFMEPQGQLTPW